MVINDLLDMAMNVPPMLAAGWGAWFFAGLLLSIWGRREKNHLVVHSDLTKHKSGARAAAGSKPPSGVRAPVKPAENVPASDGDPFGDLEKLFEPQAGAHRTPGEAPSPVLTRSNGAALAAPQSLP